MSKRSFLHYWLQNQFGEAFWKVKVGVPGLWSYIYMGKEEVWENSWSMKVTLFFPQPCSLETGHKIPIWEVPAPYLEERHILIFEDK